MCGEITKKLLCECIEKKMRWLAWQLRKTDQRQGIEEWVNSVTLLSGLLQKLNVSVDYPQITGARPNPRWSVSRPYLWNVDGDQNSEECSASEDENFNTQTVQLKTALSTLSTDVLEAREAFETKEDWNSDKLRQLKDAVVLLGSNVKDLLRPAERTIPDKPHAEFKRSTVNDDAGSADSSLRGLDLSEHKVKVESLWKDAMWRTLDKKGKDITHWSEEGNFNPLLEETCRDHKLQSSLRDEFPGRDHLRCVRSCVSFKELKEILFNEIKNYYIR